VLSAAGELTARQISNGATKTDRLALLQASLPATPADDVQPSFALASASPIPLREAASHDGVRGDLNYFTGMVHGAVPMPQPAPETSEQTEPAQAAESKPEPKSAELKPAEPKPAAEQKQAALTPAPVPHEKPKRVTPPAPAPQASGVLDDNQIAGLRGRLRLTSDQAEYWPAVEDALRDVVRTQLRPASKRAHGGKVNIDVNSAEVQKLIWAAMPLLMRLREDQKGEVRKLARVIGLDQVASQI
jgi:outer membrane biosynthesis protein TonB